MSVVETLVACGFWFCIFVFLFSLLLIVVSYQLREKQNRLLYHPEIPAESTLICENPMDRGFANAENVHIRTADGVTLRGFIMWPWPGQHAAQQGATTGAFRSQGPGMNVGIPSSSSSTTPRDSLFPSPLYAVIYFHGNSGNVGHRIPIAELLTSKNPCAVLMVDYRGFGLSDAVPPTEEGLKLDAQACLEYLWNHPRIPQGRIFVMGTSLGGAVAIDLASRRMNMKRIAGVIIENTFTSISDMASVLVRAILRQFLTSYTEIFFSVFDYYMKPLCLRIGWKNIDLVKRIRVPLLFLSGKSDELVPPSQMQRLYAAASKSNVMRKFVEFAEGAHNTLPLMGGYSEVIDVFVQEVLRLEAELV
ncbi:putative Serine peptidase, Clan SC, Family S09X [Trypanosoma cruzi]|nr:putative Serine peptidase, Clan SC, Family S09X [Trypanosoma cruzi]